MPLMLTENGMKFEDVCTVEDAMPLVEYLRNSKSTGASPQVDLSGCTYLHTALLQLLLLAKPVIAGAPKDPFLIRWIAPLLVRAGEDSV